MLFWGFDLGDGESAVARTDGETQALPEIVAVDGYRVFITAWALMKSGEVRIGESAAKSAASAIRSAARFKSRFLDPNSDTAGLTRDFSTRVLESLRQSGALKGGENNNCFYIGCPAGWDKAARERYQTIFENMGCPAPHVVSESRAVMVGSVQSNSLRDYVDLRSKSILVIDIGSSTTDFAYINKGKESEIRTGGEVALGGGIMDEVLLEACLNASSHTKALRKVFAESEPWRVDCELRARRLKEKYFSAPAEARKSGDFTESVMIAYEKPVLFDLFMNEKTALALTEKPCPQLQGRSFREVFCEGLREVRQSIGDENPPELLFLTGGVSRMEAVKEWCREVFPEAVIYTDREPEFSVARGLAWCGRIDDEIRRFRAEVDELIRSETVERIVSWHLDSLYESALDSLIDPILEKAVKPVLVDWRDGKIETLAKMEPILQERIKVFLYSDEAKACLSKPVEEWMRKVSTELETHTSPICRKFHVPDHSLEITSGLSASDLSVLEKIDTLEIFATETITGTLLVDSIISAIVAFFCGGSGVTLIAEGPVGLVVGFILSLLVLAIGHVMGKNVLDQKVMEANIPLFVRRMALSRTLPKLEMPKWGFSKKLKKVFTMKDDTAGEKKDDEDEDSGFHLLPRLKKADSEEISDRRLRAIRGKMNAGYAKLLENKESPEWKELNRRVSREISEQIEIRLKELAEQVEIPL